MQKAVGLNAWRKQFITRVLLVSMAMQTPAVLIWSRALHVSVLWVALAHLAMLAITLRRLVYWNDESAAPWWRTWLVEVPYGAYSSGCFIAAPVTAIALVTMLLIRLLTDHRGPEVMSVLTAIQCVGWAMAAYGSTVGRMVPRTIRIEVSIEGLSPDLDGYRIAQLSDIHCGPYVPRWLLAYWARKATALGPDLTTVTGDLIAAGSGYLTDVTYFFEQLRAPDGVVACLGNHDYFATEGVPAAVEAGGARLLRNAGFILQRGDGGLYVCAIDDRWSRRDNIAEALRARPNDMPSVMLAHDPQQFPEIAAEGVSLVLSGHTHGGQFAVPFLVRWLNLARLRMPFTKGVYKRGASTLFVHAGLGTSGPATRIGAAPEVALIVLRRAS